MNEIIKVNYLIRVIKTDLIGEKKQNRKKIGKKIISYEFILRLVVVFVSCSLGSKCDPLIAPSAVQRGAAFCATFTARMKVGLIKRYH